MGRVNCKRGSGVEEECEMLWLLSKKFSRTMQHVWCWDGGVGWGGIITNVIVVLKKSVKRCGCFQEQCSTPRARLVLRK